MSGFGVFPIQLLPLYRVLPFYEEHDVKLLRILTDRGTEYCGKQERHEYQLYLSVEDIEHTRTKVRHPQTNGICERFHKTMQDEFYSAAFRKKVYISVEELQKDVDEWLEFYNEEGCLLNNRQRHVRQEVVPFCCLTKQ